MSPTPALPTPKYQIGQQVWLATTTSTTAQHPCPDCLDTRAWEIKSPAGLVTTIPCPRCTRGSHFINHQQIPRLSYCKHVAATQMLTIGSITAKTHPYSSDDGVEYMCKETGIGSGNVWSEGRLFATEQEAMEAAIIMAAEKQASADALPHALKSVAFVDMACDLAAYTLSWNGIYRSWESARDYREIVDRIEEAGRASLDDIQDLIACKEEKPWRHPHPLAAILEAVRVGDFEAARCHYDDLPKPQIPPAARAEPPIETTIGA